MTIALTYDERIVTLTNVRNWYLSPQETQLVVEFEDGYLSSFNLNKIIEFKITDENINQ